MNIHKILHPLQWRRHKYATRPRPENETWLDREDYEQSLADHHEMEE